MSPTSGVDLITVAFATLTADEQEDAFARIGEIRRAAWPARTPTRPGMIRSMLRVAEEVGRMPSVDDYRRVQPLLRAAGEDVEPLSRLQRHFGGSYRRAIEAMELSEVTTPAGSRPGLTHARSARCGSTPRQRRATR